MIIERIVLDNISLKGLEYLEINKKYCFDISEKVSKDILDKLNIFLADNKISLVYFECRLVNEKTSEFVYNLDALKYLTNAKHLFIFPKNDRTDLTTLENFKYLKELEEFILLGVYKKSLDLTPLLKFKDSIKRITIENGLTKKQQGIINQCTNIQNLKVKELDLSSFEPKEKLIGLEVNSNLYQMSLVPTKFPKLESLRLQGCRSSMDVPSLNTMTSLKMLDLFWIYSIEDFPDLTNLIDLRELRCTLPNLKNLDSLWELIPLEYLQKLSICELKNLEPHDFTKISDFKSLKKAYITWKDLQKHEEIKNLIEKLGLEYVH